MYDVILALSAWCAHAYHGVCSLELFIPRRKVTSHEIGASWCRPRRRKVSFEQNATIFWQFFVCVLASALCVLSGFTRAPQWSGLV